MTHRPPPPTRRRLLTGWGRTAPTAATVVRPRTAADPSDVSAQIEAADLSHDNPNEWLVRNAPYSDGTMRCGAELAGALAGHLGCAARDAVLVVERATWLEGAPITLARQHYAPAYGLTLAL